MPEVIQSGRTAVVGQPVDRVDGPAKVTGRAEYTVDAVRPGMVYGYVVTSTVASATITAVNALDAENAPGVVAVYSPFRSLPIRALGSPTNPTGPRWAPLQDAEVHHHGQPVAFVVAETFEQARDAAALVELVYDCRTSISSLQASLARATAPGHIETGEAPTVGFLADGVRTIEDAVRDSQVVVAGTYTTPSHNHAAMEPHGSIAWWEPDGTLRVRTGHQALGWLTGELGACLDVEPSQVHVVSTFVGGAFGGKTRAGVDVKLGAAAARDLGRPVKTVLTREQVFSATAIRGTTHQEVTLGARHTGELTAVQHRSWSGESSMLSDLLVVPGHLSSRMLYGTENMQIEQLAVSLNIPRTGYVRAPSEMPGIFAVETAMDELASALDLDPIELRRRNDTTVFPGLDVAWSSKHLDECFTRGAEEFGWQARSSQPRATLDGDWYVGLGVATTTYRAFRLVPVEMQVSLRADGTVVVSGCAVDLGHGVSTVLAMVAADATEVPLERVGVRTGDSSLSPGAAMLGSTGTGSVGPAAHLAGLAARDALLDLAATHPRSPFRGCLREELHYAAGVVHAGEGAMSFDRLLTLLDIGAVDGTGRTSPQRDVDEKFAHYSFGAQFCEVRVNRWTREPRVSRMLSVMDIGTVVNPKTARSQIMGSMIWGMSAALYEGIEIDNRGTIVNGNLAEYLMPVNADVPDVDVIFLDHPDLVHNPLGTRGAGEIGVGGMTAAVNNAIFNAVGIRVRDLPVTLDKLLADS